MKFEAVIIGGGISGITTALILAKRGMKVALVERDRQLAPVLRGFKRNGTYFDTGLHYTGGLAPDGPLWRYFQHLGIAEKLTLSPYPEDGFDEIRFKDTGRVFVQPHGRARLEESLKSSFPESEVAISAYLEEIDKEWEHSSYLNLGRPFADESFSLTRDERTLHEFLTDLNCDKELEAILSAHTILYGVPPERALLRTHAQVAGSYVHSVHGLHDGGRSIVQACAKQLACFGVDVFTGREAVQLHLDTSGAMQGVGLVDGIKLQTGLCVATSHPSTTIRMLPNSVLRPAYRKRMLGLENCHSALMAFGKLKTIPDSLRHRNILNFSTSDARTMYPAPGDLSRSPLFIGRAEEDGSVALMISALNEVKQKWMDEAGRRTEAYRQYKEFVLEQFMESLEQSCPEIASELEIIELATPLTFRDYGCLPSGGIYGVEHAQGQYPVLPMTKIKGLLFAGQSVIAPGVLGAVISAYVACGLVIGQEALRQEVIACS